MGVHINVLSASNRLQPNAQFVAWLENQRSDSLWISRIALFEARCGMVLLSPSQRKRLLQERVDQPVQADLVNRLQPFDADAATQVAQFAAESETGGRPVDMCDTFIVGISPAKRSTLATRNTRHLDDLSVRVVNPWAASQLRRTVLIRKGWPHVKTIVVSITGPHSRTHRSGRWTLKITLPELAKELIDANYSAARRDSMVDLAGFNAYDFYE